MPDYSKGKIYTIRCRDDPSLIYVGSTIQSLSKRLGGHKIDGLKHPNMLFYQKVNNNWNNWYIEIYCECNCENKEQLLKKEGEVIREIATLNKQIAGRTKEEYKNENKDKIKERNKESRKKYYDENKDKILEQKKEYRKQNKEIIKEINKKWYEDNKDREKERQKQYRKQNTDKEQERQKKYIEQNKNKIKEYYRLYYLRKKQ